MKKFLFMILLGVFSVLAFGQTTDTLSLEVKDITLDLLKSPTNPAFLLMGTSPVEIAEPASAPEFYASIQNASGDFTTFPNNYGFTVTPYWWTKKAERLSFDRDFDTVNHFNFFRTLSLSGGMVRGVDQQEQVWRYGLGFQTSLLRGRIDPALKADYRAFLREYHETYFGTLEEYYAASPEYVMLEAERISINRQVKSIDSLLNAGQIDPDSAQVRKIELITTLMMVQQQLDEVKTLLGSAFNEENGVLFSTDELNEKFNQMNQRTGFKWDIGGGVAINSPDNKLDSTGIYRAGFWSNFGGDILNPDTANLKLSGFLLTRYLYYDEVYYRKDGTNWLIEGFHAFDIGGRLNVEVTGKFVLGVEAVYRSRLSGSVYESNYKINGLAQYHFGANKLLYASIGNAFNDRSDGGPEDLVVTFGVNIGFGGNIDLYDLGF